MSFRVCWEAPEPQALNPKKPCTPRRSLPSPNSYLEGQGDLVSRFIRELTRVTIWVIELINLISKSLDPPSKPYVDLGESLPSFGMLMWRKVGIVREEWLRTGLLGLGFRIWG